MMFSFDVIFLQGPPSEPTDLVRLALPQEKKSWFSKWFENPQSFTNWTGLPGFITIFLWKLGIYGRDESAPADKKAG